MLANFNFLSSHGELGARLRAVDWSATALGPPQQWPVLLANTLQLIGAARQPMALFWGADHLAFGNDALLRLLPDEVSDAPGQPGRTAWARLWPVLAPQIDQVMSGTGATWNEEQPIAAPGTVAGAGADAAAGTGPDGRRWWTWGCSPVGDEHGIHGVLMVCTDVTPPRRSQAAAAPQAAERGISAQPQPAEAARPLSSTHMEQDLHLQREAEGERLRVLFEQAHGFMAILRGPDHVFEFANAAYLALVGERDVIGKPVREALPDVHGQGFYELLDKVYQSGEPFKAADQLLTLNHSPDGRPQQAYLDFVYQPIWLAGSVDGIFVQGFDTTERALARQAMERSELRLRQGMKAAGMVVWDWDLASNQVDFSDNAPELFGATWRHMAAVWDAVDADDLARLEQERCAALACNGTYGEIVRLRRPDNGQLVWLQIRATVVADAEGVPYCIRGVSIDVSARKRAEESLREVSRHKDEFLAMLSHELRNPLAPIRSAAHLLGMAPDNVARVKQSSVIIERQVNHMTSLINDLLDVSRVNTGLVTLDKQVVDMHQVVIESLEQTQPLMNDRNHLLRVSSPPEGEVLVLGDRKRLVQVLTNLLHNAAKYTPPGGKIALTVSRYAGMVEIHVSDNGIGVDADLMPHIFELFTQEKRSSDRTQGGLGLGLALVRSLVLLHGGHVTVASEGVGEGATFSVYLQRHQQQENVDLGDVHARREPGALLRLMVVDDNVDAAHALAMLLELEGHTVLVEHDPLRALERAAEFAPDACVLDIGLPGLDGYELARRLRAAPETAGATLIALTGYGNKYSRETSVSAGFDFYFVKPAKTTELFAVLASIQPVDSLPLAQRA